MQWVENQKVEFWESLSFQGAGDSQRDKWPLMGPHGKSISLYPQVFFDNRGHAVNMAEGTSPKLSNIPDVEIDENGRFKYILIKVIDDTHDNVYKYIVRGFAWASYHGRFLCTFG